MERSQKVAFLGAIAIDHYYQLQGSWPELGSKAEASAAASLSGGMIPNAATLFASLGGTAHYITSLADADPSSPFLIEELKNSGVNTAGIGLGAFPKNDECLIITDGIERIIYVITNPNKKKLSLSIEQRALITESSYLYSTVKDLVLLEDPQALIKLLKVSSTGLFLDCDSFFPSKKEDEILFQATIISMNEFGHEAMRQRGIKLEALFARGSLETLLITRGARGSTLYSRNASISARAYSVDLVDSTGAGDAFNSAFLFSRLAGTSLRASLQFATATGSLMTTYKGGRHALSRTAIEQLIASNRTI